MRTMTSPRPNYRSGSSCEQQKIQKAIYFIKILCDASNIMQTMEARTDEVSPYRTPTQYNTRKYKCSIDFSIHQQVLM